jgi:D-lactate dehydrogenase (cytochrome)
MAKDTRDPPCVAGRNPDGVAALLAELAESGTALRTPFRIETGRAVRRAHANAVTGLAAELPDAVIWPRTIEDVSRIVRLAGRHRVPVIAFGGGTSLEGQVNAPLGGVSLDMSAMDRILAVRERDLHG